MIFVDTSAWVAFTLVDDEYHQAAVHWLSQNSEPLLTTDFVFDEILTLIQARGQKQRAVGTGVLLFTEEMARFHRISSDQFGRAWQVFRDFKDKRWSFTDCTSKVVMDDLGISTAFTFDHHFRQFGNITVVP